ncbi:MAG: hypothetical protein N2234_07870, partial [Planctomycetota bacterium]|nr:hypothetical protein [Planctomycetota bacterium]
KRLPFIPEILAQGVIEFVKRHKPCRDYRYHLRVGRVYGDYQFKTDEIGKWIANVDGIEIEIEESVFAARYKVTLHDKIWTYYILPLRFSNRCTTTKEELELLYNLIQQEKKHLSEESSTKRTSDELTKKASSTENYFYREGEYWQIRFQGGKQFLLKHRLGLHYIAIMLHFPNQRFSPEQLEKMVRGSLPENKAGANTFPSVPQVDRKAIKDFEKRRKDIEKEIQARKEDGDFEKARELEEEKEEIEEQIRAGKFSKFAGAKQLAYKRVGENIRSALRIIQNERSGYPPLGQHLTKSLHIGVENQYNPAPPVQWDVRF